MVSRIRRFVPGRLLRLVPAGLLLLVKLMPSNGSLLRYLPELDTLRSSASFDDIRRVGNVDVLLNSQSIASLEGVQSQHSEIGVCHLVHLFEGSFLSPNSERTLINVFGSWEGTAAIAIAAEHLNTGNGVIVPEVAGINSTCNIRFTVESVDVENASQNNAVEDAIQLTERLPVRDRLPCSVIGPYLSRTSQASALLFGIRGVPQVSPSAASPELDIKSQYPLFGRTVSSNQDSAELAVMYLHNELGVDHLAVLHHPDEFGNSYALGLQLAAKKLAPDMIVRTVEMTLRLDESDDRIPDDVSRAVGFLKDTQYTYIFSLTNHNFHDMIMVEAYHQKLAGTGRHNWFFAETLGEDFITDRRFEKGSPLHLAHIGISRFSATGGVRGLSPQFDKLESLLKEFRNSEDVEYLRDILPKYSTNNSSIFDEILDSEVFLQSARHPTAFAYDAAIAIGLAACNATKPDGFFDGFDHVASFRHGFFKGATGQVKVDPGTGSRLPQSMTFELVSHHLDTSRETETEVGFKIVRTALFEDGGWNSLEAQIFNDGSTDIPPDLPAIEVDQHLLTPVLRAGGLIMCSLSFIISILFAAWTQKNKESRVVKAAQPVFLHIVCAGALVLSSTIIPLSIDPGVATLDGNDTACMAVPWLFTIGFSVMMSALWAKTSRIHRIFKSGATFRRVRVTAAHVYRPMAVVHGANVAILSLWTVLSPIRLETQAIYFDSFGRATETYSFCDWSDSAEFYSSLVLINLLLLGCALFLAWRTRSISTEFSESVYIYKAANLTLVVCFIGIPVIILASENPAAFFYVASGMIFVMSTSFLILIFCPKVAALRETTNPSTPTELINRLPSRYANSGVPPLQPSETSRPEASSGDMRIIKESDTDSLPQSNKENEEIAAAGQLQDEVQRLLEENRRLESENKMLRAPEASR